MPSLPNSRYRLIAFVAVTALAGSIAILAGCSKSKSTGPVGDPRFTPESVTLVVGDTVKWTATNGDHTVTSGTGSNDPASGQLFDHELNEGGTFRFVFNNVGVFPYYCIVHEDDEMTGTVTVAALSNKTVDVLAAGTSFNPSAETINVGDTVRWTASGSHTITSGTGSTDPDAGELFDHPFTTNQTFSFKFTAAGTYPYFCRIHGDMGMHGTITVVEPKPTTVSVEATM